ncbi:DUF4328 domain-containing protein [Myroides odoratus]|uniref:DUF4328 domain-containing protein n=1 Tax=Myroides odoratus TaxID=256 RepID=UPI00333F6A80
MERLNPNGQRAKNAIILIWIMLALDIISLISGYFQFDLLQMAAKGNEISIEQANANDTREQVISLLCSIAYIISGVTFIQWFRRAYYNLHLRVTNLSYKEGWAAGSWFVPILCLFRPYQIMKELHVETKALLARKGVSMNQNFSANILGIWWAFWIVNNAMGQYIFRYAQRAETIDELTICTVTSMANNIIGVLLALLTIKVITNYATVEPLLLESDESPKASVELIVE